MDNRTLIRDVIVFQFKLVADGLRDVALVPLSIAAGIVSLLSTRDGKPGPHFYSLLGVGRQSDHWINLFGALRNAPEDLDVPEPFPDADLDVVVGHIEAFVVDEEKRGGMTAQARERFEKALRSFQDRRDAHTPGRADRDEPAP